MANPTDNVNDVTNFVRAKGKTEKDTKIRDLSYLLENVALPSMYQNQPIEGTGDLPFELALRKKIAEETKKQYGVSQPFSGARNRGNLTEAIGEAYSQTGKSKKESWKDYIK